jgi:class 3 adenylate cyclase
LIPLLILGFTAWSSEREPEQVFALLQSLYQSFDKIAKKRGVFKVETIGKQWERKATRVSK